MRKLLMAMLLAGLLSACVTQPSGIDSLQGTWAVTMGEHEGESMQAVVGGVMTITGDDFQIRAASGTQLQGRLQRDSTQRPAALDFIHDNGMRWLAIYEVQGSSLHLNYVDVVVKEPRPVEFATSDASLLLLRR